MARVLSKRIVAGIFEFFFFNHVAEIRVCKYGRKISIRDQWWGKFMAISFRDFVKRLN